MNLPTDFYLSTCRFFSLFTMFFAGFFVTSFQYLGLSCFSVLCCLAMILSPTSKNMPILFTLGFFATQIPLVSAAPQTQPFPNIPFKVFSTFIEQSFSPQVSLATVLLVLFSLIENPELLNLHARQQNPEYDGEHKTVASGWMRALSRAIMHQLKTEVEMLFCDREFPVEETQQVTKLSGKLHDLAITLNLTPYSHKKFRGNLLPISYDTIQGIPTICPNTPICLNANCKARGLLQATKLRDIPLVTLIKEDTVYQDVPVLTGKCTTCDTTYHGDHERFKDEHRLWNKCYLNSARFLKIGQSLWVDRKFSHSVLSAIYNFHASASAFTQYWNDHNPITNSNFQITRRQVWQAFVQESIRTIASVKNIDLELKENFTIEEVAGEAFAMLGNTGIIEPGKKHSCSECSQPFKHAADFMINEDPAAVLGVDENSVIPALEGEHAALSAHQTAVSRQAARARANDINNSAQNEMDIDYDNCTMIVLDGIVFGPKVRNVNNFYIKITCLFFFKHCAQDGCIKDVKNARGGAFCEQHEDSYGDRCRVRDCTRTKVVNTQACEHHQEEWRKYKLDHSRSSLAGVKKMLQRPNESNPWQPGLRRTFQAHDDDNNVEIQRKNFFGPGQFYCVETICAPCGVVIAWTKFDKSESPTNILNFLKQVYPTEISRPNYICIDKACQVLRTAIANKSWFMWEKTSRFIVDSYHYINHRKTDYMCRTYCNPGPLDGSAPNLIKVAQDKEGRPYFQRAFNTQVYICIYF
jgi:hypothetical protein